MLEDHCRLLVSHKLFKVNKERRAFSEDKRLCGLNLDASNLYKSGARTYHAGLDERIDEDWLDAIRALKVLAEAHVGLVGLSPGWMPSCTGTGSRHWPFAVGRSSPPPTAYLPARPCRYSKRKKRYWPARETLTGPSP